MVVLRYFGMLLVLLLVGCAYEKNTFYYMSFEEVASASVVPKIEYGIPNIDDVKFYGDIPISYQWEYDNFSLMGTIDGPRATPHMRFKIQDTERGISLRIVDSHQQTYIRGNPCFQASEKTPISSIITWSKACVGKGYSLSFNIQIVEDNQNIIFSEIWKFTLKEGGHYYLLDAL